VPAAVVIIGNMRGSALAASSAALYPAIDAIDDSASMLWARVMRGMNSTENRVAPACAYRAARAGSESGSQNPIAAVPFWGGDSGTRTCSSTCACSST
jgi:hypothetical protein